MEEEVKDIISESRVGGLHKGAIWMSDDFDEQLPDEFWVGTSAQDPQNDTKQLRNSFE